MREITVHDRTYELIRVGDDEVRVVNRQRHVTAVVFQNATGYEHFRGIVVVSAPEAWTHDDRRAVIRAAEALLQDGAEKTGEGGRRVDAS